MTNHLNSNYLNSLNLNQQQPHSSTQAQFAQQNQQFIQPPLSNTSFNPNQQQFQYPQQPQPPHLQIQSQQPQQILLEHITPSSINKPKTNSDVAEINNAYINMVNNNKNDELIFLPPIVNDKSINDFIINNMLDLTSLIKFLSNDDIMENYNRSMSGEDKFVNYSLLFRVAQRFYSSKIKDNDDLITFISILLFLGVIHNEQCEDVLDMIEKKIKLSVSDSRYSVQPIFKKRSFDFISDDPFGIMKSKKTKNEVKIATESNIVNNNDDDVDEIHNSPSIKSTQDKLESYKYLKYMRILNIFKNVIPTNQMQFVKNFQKNNLDLVQKDSQFIPLYTITMNKPIIVSLSSHTSVKDQFKFIILDNYSNTEIKRACVDYIKDFDKLNVEFEVVLGQTKKGFDVYNLYSKQYSDPIPLDKIDIATEVSRGKYYYAVINSIILRKNISDGKISLRTYSRFIFSFDLSNNLNEVMKSITTEEQISPEDIRDMYPTFQQSVGFQK